MHRLRLGWETATRNLPAFLLLLCIELLPKNANAYGFMIRHGYTNCAQCHVDPSGGGLLTPYGRAQTELLLQSHYTQRQEDEEASELSNYLFGIIDLPEPLILGGSFRNGILNVVPSGASVTTKFLLMQADLQGQFRMDRFRANASVGLAKSTGALEASLTSPDSDLRLVSRNYWVGVDLGEEQQFLLRAGRMNLPFGLRNIEHTTFIRSDTRTDTNAAQQVGASLAYSGQDLRGELMAIVGNFQVSPDDFRERGYSGYLEWAPAERLAIGASSLLTHSSLDYKTNVETFRHAHGIFGRYSPAEDWVISTEIDFLLNSTPAHNAYGTALFAQADFEPWQGLHFLATLEGVERDFSQGLFSTSAWASIWWFFLPHTDLRLDFIQQKIATPSASQNATTILAQLHIFL